MARLCVMDWLCFSAPLIKIFVSTSTSHQYNTSIENLEENAADEPFVHGSYTQDVKEVLHGRGGGQCTHFMKFHKEYSVDGIWLSRASNFLNSHFFKMPKNSRDSVLNYRTRCSSRKLIQTPSLSAVFTLDRKPRGPHNPIQSNNRIDIWPTGYYTSDLCTTERSAICHSCMTIGYSAICRFWSKTNAY